MHCISQTITETSIGVDVIRETGKIQLGLLSRFAFYGGMIAIFAPRVFQYLREGEISGAIILFAIGCVIAVLGGEILDPRK